MCRCRHRVEEALRHRQLDLQTVMMLSLTDLKTLSYPRLPSLTVAADGSPPEVTSSHLSPVSEQTSPTSTYTANMMASPDQQLEADFDMQMDGLVWRDLDLNCNTTTAASLGIGGPLHHVRKILISAPQPEVDKGRPGDWEMGWVVRDEMAGKQASTSVTAYGIW